MKYREFYLPTDIGTKSMECDLYMLPNGDVNELYALSKDQIASLPIKVKKRSLYYLNREDKACFIVEEYASFKITSRKEMELKEAITPFIFKHENAEEYEVYVVLDFALLIGKGAVWKSGIPAYGKSSILKTMNKVFGSVPVVERVKTVPAFYKYIPEDGIMVIDEMAKKDAESSENLLYALNILGDVNEEILRMNTGGSSAFGTNVPKNIRNCSTVCIMNRLCDYESKDKFAEYMFSNNAALDRRFLKIKVSDTRIDMNQFSEWREYNDEEAEYLRKIIRTIQYYKDNYKKERNEKMVSNAFKYAEGKYQKTHIETVRLLFDIFSIYCKDDIVKFSRMIEVLFNMIKAYSDALRLGDDEYVQPSEKSVFETYKDNSEDKSVDNKSTVQIIKYQPGQKTLEQMESELI
jgi:hypothetical protein